MNVLIVDDSPEVLDLLERALRRDGHEVRLADCVDGAWRALEAETPDVVVLDVALPDGTGIELCRALRDRGKHFPILLLTAHDDVPRRVAGLDAGADDYLAKPFAVAELRARVRALGRRGPVVRTSRYEAGEVCLELAERRATRAGEHVPLTPREWGVLELLFTRHGKVVARDVILELVWGDVSERSSASLDVIVARIRRKLGGELLRTVRGQGYAIEGA